MEKEVIYILGLLTIGILKYFLLPVSTAVVTALILMRLQTKKAKKK